MRTPKFTPLTIVHTQIGSIYSTVQNNIESAIWSEFCVLCIARLSKQPRAKHQCSRNDTTRKQRWVPIEKLPPKNAVQLIRVIFDNNFGCHNVTHTSSKSQFRFDRKYSPTIGLLFNAPFLWRVFFSLIFLRAFHSTGYVQLLQFGKTGCTFDSAHSDSIRQLQTPPLDAVYRMYYSRKYFGIVLRSTLGSRFSVLFSSLHG